ncbi:MAG: nucleotidyltransferase domain-containing protein [Rhodobacteraceae bacterium]|nr:nucleotidyltransferase domain-containing protein [Paracoccaceae bacterium]
MDKAAVISAIRALRPAFEAEGVSHVYLFGSVARDEQGPASDVDLFFDHKLTKFGLIEYSGLKRFAREHLPFDADFIERSCLHPAIRPEAEAQAIRVF